MKKYYILAAVALVASAACTKVDLEPEATPDSPVTFQVANYVPRTKASSLESEGITSFSCKAYLHAEGINLTAAPDYATSQAGGSQNFFGNAGNSYIETVKLNGDTNSNNTYDQGETFVWKTDQTYYWPKSEHSFVNFVAWYGNTGTAPTVNYVWDATAGAYKATIAWAVTSTIGSSTQNLIYADMAWRFHNNTNTYVATSHVTEGVPMLFHHLLSKFCVKAYAVEATANPANPTISAGNGTVSDGTATWTITFVELSLGSIYTGATLNLSNTDPGSSRSNYTQAWTQEASTSTTSGNLTLANGANAISSVTANTANVLINETCVLPQTIGSSVVLSGKVNIHTAYANGAVNDEKIPFSFTLNAMGTNAWAQNTIYTYIIKVNPSQKVVYFDPVIAADYTAGNTTEQSI